MAETIAAALPPRLVGLLPSLALLALGALLSFISRLHPAALPPWAPWDFSWGEYLAASFGLYLYARGIARTSARLRPGHWRQASYGAGILVIWIVLQTRFDYAAQHLFALNRVQHLVLHHLGPFLIALSWPGGTLARGMPFPLLHVVQSRPVRRCVHVVQQPVLAGVLFVGLLWLWLTPPVHFRAMIDLRFYAVMNWSMVIDGTFFWVLVLDPRPSPPARLSFGARALLAFAVQMPQIAAGAAVGFIGRDLYPFYQLCGRIFPGIDALLDQQIGGSVVWFGGGMMSAIAVLIQLRAMWIDEERAQSVPAAATLKETARQW